MIEPLLVDFYPDFYNEPKSQLKEVKADNLEFQKCRRFGVGYMGSKNKIVKKLMPQLPSAKYFVDLFAGGCAMTHGAMLSGKYERFIANDISDAPSLFLRAIKGEFKDEKRWISREMYKELYDKDAYIRYVWSFGNKGGASDYLYSKAIEPYKKAFWEFAVNKNPEPLRKYGFNVDNLLSLNSSEKRRLAFSLLVAQTPNSSYNPFLQSLKCLENLQRLESLKRLERLEVYQGCYKELKLPDPSECVIYCDPPYANTTGYASGDFDHAELYDYAEHLARQGYKVFISEYWMPPERFKSVFNVDKRQQLNGLGARAIKQEHLFVPIV